MSIQFPLKQEDVLNPYLTPPQAIFNKSRAGQAQPLTFKPHSDPRSYQVASLENGLQVINIQDKTSLTSAFAVAVGAASFDNPTKFPGLAHFCEHMLFLGNEKYPDPQGFKSFVSSHGGYANAYTASEVTNYFAELSSSASEEGLDRLANFFIHPNFDKQYVTQEVNAVNSEHAKNIKDAPWFVSAIMNSLATAGSPLGEFHTGDLNTLYYKPMANGENPADALRVWYNDNYCPGRMRVATFGPEPLNEQLDRVKKDFAALPQGTDQCNKGSNDHSQPVPWPDYQMGKWVDIQGTQPQSQLWLFFPLPDLTQEYKSSPLMYLNWVFKYGGENSLSQVLEDDMGLITGLSLMNDGSSIGNSFWIILTLTSTGSNNPSTVLDVIFAYIAKLRQGVNVELYQSLVDKVKLDWDWAQPGAASSTVSSFAETMMTIPKEDLLWGGSLIKELKPDLVHQLLLLLRPDNMNVGFVNVNMTKNNGISSEAMKVFPDYNTTYLLTDLKAKFAGARERWSLWLDSNANNVDVNTELKSTLLTAGVSIESSPIPTPPGPIIGIPKDINLDNMAVVGDFSNSKSVDLRLFGPHPEKSERPSGSLDEVWVRSGWVTTSPEVHFGVSMRKLVLPTEPDTSAFDLIRMSFYGSLLATDMAPKLFDLEAAGGSYSLSLSTSGISMSFSGYQPALPQLVKGTMAGFLNGVNESSPKVIKKFSQLMAQQKDSLQTYSRMPYSYALADRGLILQRGIYSNEEMLEALKDVELHNSVTAVKELLLSRPLQATSLSMGNADKGEALQTINTLIEGIRSSGIRAPVAGDEGSVEHVTPVINFQSPIELRKSSPKLGDENGVAVVSLFAGLADIETRVILNLIGDIINPIAYGYLRTTKQLGYVVNAGASLMSNVMYLSTVVQGTAEQAEKMEAHIEYVYTKLMPEALANLSDAEYNNYKSSFANSMLEPPKTAGSEFSHSWSHASEGGHCFGLVDEMLSVLNDLTTKAPLIEFYNKLVFPKTGPRMRFSVKYFAGDVPARPSKEAMAATWAEAGVPSEGLALLDREYDHAIVFDRADSLTRKELHKLFDYHPKDVICSRRSEAQAGR